VDGKSERSAIPQKLIAIGFAALASHSGDCHGFCAE
jgi:hypothetical protein